MSQPIKLKSYFSGTVEAAMDLARRELGEDALVINARPATPETRHLGAYEVVFGVPANPVDKLTQDVADLRREIERLTGAMRNAAPAAPAVDPPVCATDSTLGIAGKDRAVVALVGPPGAGKTATLAKLAAHYGLADRKPTQILSVDVLRIAAAEQLRTLASILGLGCEVLETPLALAQAIEEYRTKQLLLIDTPGFAASEMDDAAPWAELLAAQPEVETHLVLPASLNSQDLARAADRFGIFQPSKVILTRLDETSRYTDLFAEVSRWSVPVSFLCAGQKIPDDIEPATEARLRELLAPPRRMGAAA